MKRAVAFGAALLAASAWAKTQVLVSFDTEDWVDAGAAQGITEVLDVCDELGITAHFQVVGEMAESLERWERQDIIERMKKHVVCYHSRWHSKHPNLMELTDVADYRRAYAEVFACERPGVESVRRVFGVANPLSACPPANMDSYAAYRVYSDLGIRWFAGPMYMWQVPGEDVWFGGLRHIPYNFSMDSLQRDRKNGFVDWPKDKEKTLARFAGWKRFFVYAHPHCVFTKEYTRPGDYAAGKLRPKWSELEQKERRSRADVIRYLDDMRSFLRAIKEDGRFEIVTLRDPRLAEKPRVAIRREHLPAVRDSLAKEFGPVRAPANWCVADVFNACAAFLRGEKEWTPSNAYGFLEKPEGVKAPVRVTLAEMKAAAMAMKRAEDFLPERIAVGANVIGPADFLFAALDLIVSGSDSTMIVPREQLGDFRHLPQLEKHSILAAKILYKPDFKDEYCAERLRRQLWTLRFE